MGREGAARPAALQRLPPHPGGAAGSFLLPGDARHAGRRISPPLLAAGRLSERARRSAAARARARRGSRGVPRSRRARRLPSPALLAPQNFAGGRGHRAARLALLLPPPALRRRPLVPP